MVWIRSISEGEELLVMVHWQRINWNCSTRESILGWGMIYFAQVRRVRTVGGVPCSIGY